MMRGVFVKVLTAGLIVLAASPAFAQQPGRQRGGFGGGFGGMTAPSAAALLRNDKVQEELKLTDAQKADLTKAEDAVSEKYKDDLAKARTDMDREKMAELRKAENADLEKATAGILKPEQTKRLKQIEVQAAGLNAFSKEDVQTALKLTDAQKQDVKTAVDDMQKDVQDLFKDAQGDREKMTDAIKKVQELRTDAMAGIVKGLSADQKKTWNDLTGEKFDVALLQQGRFGQGGVGAGGFGAGGRGGRRRRHSHPGHPEADRRAEDEGGGTRQGERREDPPGTRQGPRGPAQPVERRSQRRPVQAVEGRAGPTRRRRRRETPRSQPEQPQSMTDVPPQSLRGRPTAPEAIRGPLYFPATQRQLSPSRCSDGPITAR